MITDVNYYQNVKNRRASWEVIKPSDAGTVMVDAVPTLERCLALRILEMPVAEWVGDELKHNTSLPPEVYNLLQLNQQDEIKHDQVLSNLADVFPVPAKIQSEAD